MANHATANPLQSRSLIFMKVGDHANERWDQILSRKRREVDDAGMSFWGYGGSACHPLTQVQPFVRLAIANGDVPSLVMHSVRSTMDQVAYPAEEYSEDGVNWNPIPRGIRVTGSRYAIVLGDVQEGDFLLDPHDYEVGVGPSRGKRADEYLLGRTDKACIVRRDNAPPLEAATPEDAKKIEYFGKIVAPYAVLLR